jgi:hypothetical protein
MNRRPNEQYSNVGEPVSDNIEDLKKMLVETQRMNKLLQADIITLTKSNE